jgi:hypothetical protein
LDNNKTTVKMTKEAVIDYVKENPNCDKERVIRYCDDKGIASRVTVIKAIKELQYEGILNIHKRKNNSKSYVLTVDAESSLVTIPLILKDIFIQFQEFVDLVNELSKNEDDIHRRVDNSIYGDFIKTYYNRVRESLPLLPYILIDVINDTYTFYLIFFLSKKVNDQNQISKIFSIYFENISMIYSHLSIKLYNILPENSFFYSRSNPPHQLYLYSKIYHNFTRVCHLAYLCNIFGIEDSLYKVLDLLWIKNIESVSLMYNDELEHIISQYRFEESRSSPHSHLFHNFSKLKTSNNHYAHKNDILNKIHDGLNYFILMDKGLELDNFLSPFKINNNI